MVGYAFLHGHSLNTPAVDTHIVIRFCQFCCLQSEPVTPPGDRDYVFRVVRLIAYGFPKLKNVLAKVGLLHESVRPQRPHQVVF